MDFKMYRQTMGLFVDIFKRKQEIGRVKFRPQKPGYRKSSGYTGSRLPRSTPELEGLSSAYLLDFLREAQQHPTINPHTLMVLRHGRVVSECSFTPYRSDVWHVTHSMCKGVTALAIGMLADSGKLSLDEKLCDIFPGKLSPLGNPLAFLRFKNITVRHLLTMTSGVNFNEAGAVTSEDWVKGFFESGVRFEPGTEFAYNSMNSYMLSAIVRERTGMGLTQFLRPRLFLPLGMGKVHWETCPNGIEKGGWGLYLCPEDMAKLGQLLLQKGVWNGQRLISEAYLREMTAKQADTPPEMGEQGYGFQTWMGMRKGSFLFNGILGQNIIVLPDLDMVVVTTGGNDCLFKTSTVISLVERYFERGGFRPGPTLPADRGALRVLREYESAACNNNGMFPPEEKAKTGLRLPAPLRNLRKSLPVECKLLDGREYRMSPDGARLLPLFTQLLQNNYSRGVDSLRFTLEDGKFFLTVREGEDRNKIELGFGDEPVYSTVTVNRESYLVAANARFATDEDGNTVLKILLPFLENSSGRKVKIFFFRGGKIELRFSEAPDFEELLSDTGVFTNRSVAAWMNRLVARDDGDVLEYTVRRAVEPRARGKLVEKTKG